MRDLTQRTINDIVTFESVSLHAGSISKVQLIPANPNHGITINGLPLSPLYIIKTIGMTTHGFIDQVEHLSSALFSLQIDNVKIIIDSTEAPVMDGANQSILDEILKVGIKRYAKYPRKIWYPREEITVQSEDSYVKFIPHSDEFNLKSEFYCKVDFPYIGEQEYNWKNHDFDEYYENISNAKTFFWDKQIEKEYDLCRCKGVSKDINCLVFNDDDKLNNNELARHKLLDLIGDIAVFNMIIPGKFIAYKGGHKLHIELITKLWEKYAKENSLILENNQTIIPYIKIPANYDLDKIMTKFRNCIEEKNFVNSNYVKELENNLKCFLGAKHVLATNSGTSALQLSIMALDLPKPSNILVPNLTFWATYEAVKLVGHQAIVVDVDNHYQMSFDLIKKAVQEYNVKAILIVHLYGFVHPQLDEIKQFCLKNNIVLVEDGSHAFGTKYKGEFVLKNSVIAGVSLFPTKILGSAGNSGIVVTNDDHLANRVRMYRDNGRDKLRYQHELVGTNNIMNSLQAIYTDNCLEYFPMTLYKLSIIFQVYKKQLANLKIMEFTDIEHNISNGYMSTLICKVPHMLQSKLKQLRNVGISVANVYPDTISNQPGYENDITILNGTSDKICQSIINLPNYYDLTDVEQKYIIEKVKKIDKIDIVVIGCGRMGKFHLKELQCNEKFNVIGFIDLYVDKIDGLTKFNTVKEAKEAGAFTAIIATNTEYHYQVVDECLDNNLHILVEKPAFLDVESHDKVMTKAKAKNIKVCVGMVERFNPSYSEIDNIDLDDIDTIETFRICRPPNHGDKSLLLYDLACHDLDLVLKKLGTNFLKESSKLENDIYTIIGTINNKKVKMIVGYSNEEYKRNHLITLKDGSIINIDLSGKHNLLHYEHNAFFNYVLGENSNICTLDDSLATISCLNQISV
jgi:UDP-2-acetamido-2-deoxy-ribo-hexuluronate aminotransferase